MLNSNDQFRISHWNGIARSMYELWCVHIRPWLHEHWPITGKRSRGWHWVRTAWNHSAILDWFCDLHQDSDVFILFVSPLYILRCGHLVFHLEKLTLAKIDLKIRKSFMFNAFKQLFIYIIFILILMLVIAQKCIAH